MRTLSTSTTAKLFATGFTVGPIVDSLHNQCLLRYGVLPISLEWPTMALQQNHNALVDIAISSSSSSSISSSSDISGISGSIMDHYPYFFCSSWIVPPLLGFAYVILGGVLPRIVESISGSLLNQTEGSSSTTTAIIDASSPSLSSQQLRSRALLAVTTTAMIIKLSEFLETHPGVFDNNLDAAIVHNNHPEVATASLFVMIAAAIFQWAVLDGSLVALLVATVTAIGGPLTELPFVGHGVWTYLEGAADYFPLQNVFPNAAAATTAIDNNDLFLQLPQILFGTSNYQDLALSSITGPCYFAVAMDAIALGRWFDSSLLSTSSSSSSSPSMLSDNTKR